MHFPFHALSSATRFFKKSPNTLRRYLCALNSSSVPVPAKLLYYNINTSVSSIAVGFVCTVEYVGGDFLIVV